MHRDKKTKLNNEQNVIRDASCICIEIKIIIDFTLSMTASTPINVFGFDGTRETGIPPPPQAIGKIPGEYLSRVLIASICKISNGGGDGTTRR